ncbi:MAG: polysaccharide biosynthesis/export family protein [Longimicrobiales bacterium]|nr:polysaccharide biosynthesis/export family protein [Longimicrobiales bacterium]
MTDHAQGPRLTRFPLRRPIALFALGAWLPACSGQPASLPPQPVMPETQELGPGDVVQIQVWRQPDYSGEITVGADGNLLHPIYRDLVVAGMTVPEARAEVQSELSRYIQGAQVVVEPLFRVSVGGEVREPGVYPMLRGTTVAEAVAMAGGPTAVARLDEVRLLRNGTEYLLRLEAEELITFGELRLASGDQILVERQSDFSVWRDVVGPVATLAALLLTVLRIGNER